MKIIKPGALLILGILTLPIFTQAVNAQQMLKFGKADFYNVMANGDVNAIDNELVIVQGHAPNKDGYSGALLMKKAGLISRPKKKLDLFKEGRIKLETAIQNDNENVENHFLRLAIEEHAPKIVKYHSDIEADKVIVKRHFKDLQPEVQQAILDYCKNSKVLRAEDLTSR